MEDELGVNVPKLEKLPLKIIAKLLTLVFKVELALIVRLPFTPKAPVRVTFAIAPVLPILRSLNDIVVAELLVASKFLVP